MKIESFSCLKKEVINALENKQTYLDKYSLKRYENKEKVYVFTKKSVRNFLKELQVSFEGNS